MRYCRKCVFMHPSRQKNLQRQLPPALTFCVPVQDNQPSLRFLIWMKSCYEGSQSALYTYSLSTRWSRRSYPSSHCCNRWVSRQLHLSIIGSTLSIYLFQTSYAIMKCRSHAIITLLFPRQEEILTSKNKRKIRMILQKWQINRRRSLEFRVYQVVCPISRGQGYQLII